MTPAAEAILRAALRAASAARSSETRLVAQFISDALQADGLAVDAAPPAAPRATSTDRVRRWRAEQDRLKRDGPVSRNALEASVETLETHETHETLGREGRALSLDLVSDHLDREREREETHETPESVTGVTRVSPGGLISLTQALTPELRSIAELQQVQDVEGAWAKFTGHHNGRSIDVAGQWQKWCVNERNRERSERHRRANGTSQPQESSKLTEEETRAAEKIVDDNYRRARDADAAQGRRARVATRRPQSEPVGAGPVAATPKAAKTPEEIEAERERQRQAAADAIKTGGLR